MVAFHKEYKEYVTCTVCGFKKYCKPNGQHFICYACANGNFAKVKWNQSKYPLHPPHAHAAPLYATVPLAEYRAPQKKLDICQKECIRIAELYKRDKQLFNTKVKRIIRHINELKKR